EILKFLKNYESKIKKLAKESAIAHWNAQVTGKKELYKKAEELSKKIQKIHNSKEDYEKSKKFYESNIKDPLIKRQIKLIYESYLANQGDIKLIHEITEKESAIDHSFNTFRAEINKKKLTDNQIKELLKKEKNSEKLKKYWEASKKQGEVVNKQLIKIIKLRNKLATSLNFKDYYEFSLFLQEQNKEQLIKIFKELEESTNEAFEELKKEIDSRLKQRYSVEELKPWHYQDLFFQEAPSTSEVNLDEYYNKDILEVARKFYQSINLEVDDIISRSSWYEAEGKCQHAFCMNVDREGDVRVLENIKENEYWMETTLHELGHAVYDKFTDKNLPFLLRDAAHILTTEAIAMLFGRLSHSPDFLKNYTEISEKELKKIIPTLEKMSRMKQLIMTRWILVMFNFEIKMYENPDQNLNELWWQLVKKYQFINFSRDKPDWASKIHFTIAPVYYHNYMLGELYASQIHKTISKLTNQDIKQVKYSGNEEIGKYLKEKIFSKGMILPWDKLIKESTGEELTPKSYVQQFVK
ncbi:MAG: peptidase M3, partial [Nanoarchaeota archaeon]|nr:peptidase M3 [Nanoarchaeota archaeon]